MWIKRRKILFCISASFLLFFIFTIRKCNEEQPEKDKENPFDFECGCRRLLRPHNESFYCSEFASSRGKGQKVFSYSLFGWNLNRYIEDVDRNAEEIQKLFPDFTLRIYHDIDILTSYRNHAALCHVFCNRPNVDLCNVRRISRSSLVGLNRALGLIWRFAPMSDPDVAEFHSRDLDSRPSEREKAAILDWKRSNAKYHVMRDHPMHGRVPIPGGLFGMKITSGDKFDFAAMLEMAMDRPWKGLDQVILELIIYPNFFIKSALIHDSFSCNSRPKNEKKFIRPFPTKRLEKNFVGSNGGIITKECPLNCRKNKKWNFC